MPKVKGGGGRTKAETRRWVSEVQKTHKGPKNHQHHSNKQQRLQLHQGIGYLPAKAKDVFWSKHMLKRGVRGEENEKEAGKRGKVVAVEGMGNRTR